ncbi:MAG: hypothetical protein NWS47_02455 [Alphaproteobacteria bacterium]|nr:hypothetical protein [Alphaproteobacteria bacterium]
MSLIKKYIFLVAVVFAVSCKENKNESQPLSTQISDLIHADGMVTDTVIEILGQSGVRIKGMPAKENWPAMMAELDSPHCKNVKNLIQGKDPRYPKYAWFAKPGVERWDMAYDGKANNIQRLLDLILSPKVDNIKGLNMGAAAYPASSTFSSILLLGSTIGDFQSRINFLNTLINKNKIKSDLSTIYILTGKRSFNNVEKEMLTKNGSIEALNILKADSEKVGLEWVYNQSKKESAFMKLPVIIIDDAHPIGMRATTESTLALFFKQKSLSKDQKVLAVSSHIFALYQYLILKRVAYQYGFEGYVDVCAPALRDSERDAYPDSKKLAMLLDNLARIFYEICLYKEKTGVYPS